MISSRKTCKIEPNYFMDIPTSVNRFSSLTSYNFPSTPLGSNAGGELERDKHFCTQTNKNYQITDHCTHSLKTNKYGNYRFLSSHPVSIPQDSNCNYPRKENIPHLSVPTHHIKVAFMHNDSHKYFQIRAASPSHVHTNANSYNRSYELNYQDNFANNSTNVNTVQQNALE